MSAFYAIEPPEGGFRKIETFTDAEIAKLLPIAETLAMLDGNAFFTVEPTWAHQYIPEAAHLYEMNGGDEGWAGTASFVPKPKLGATP